MNNPEFEPEMLEDIDVSGYSEKRADKQIDKVNDTGQGNVKQFNRITKSGSFVPNKKKKDDDEKDKDHVVFKSK